MPRINQSRRLFWSDVTFQNGACPLATDTDSFRESSNQHTVIERDA